MVHHCRRVQVLSSTQLFGSRPTRASSATANFHRVRVRDVRRPLRPRRLSRRFFRYRYENHHVFLRSSASIILRKLNDREPVCRRRQRIRDFAPFTPVSFFDRVRSYRQRRHAVHRLTAESAIACAYVFGRLCAIRLTTVSCDGVCRPCPLQTAEYPVEPYNLFPMGRTVRA